MGNMLRMLAQRLKRIRGGDAGLDCSFLAIDMTHPDWFARAKALHSAGKLRESLDCLDRAIEVCHNDVEVLRTQARVLRELGRQEDAADSLELALAFAPDRTDLLIEAGSVAREMKNETRAFDYLQRAIKISSDNVDAHFEMAQTCKRFARFQEAIACYKCALALDPNHLASAINAGMVYLAHLGDPAAARRMFDYALILQPDSVAAQANLGLALQEGGQIEGALEYYDRLISLYPKETELRWNRGIALLGKGDFYGGWLDYEVRNSRPGKSGARQFPFPAWGGDSLKGRKILIHAEQGLGDEIMFASCLPDVIRQTKGAVVECDLRLESLFRRSFPDLRVHGAQRNGNRDWLKAFPKIDVQVGIGSLPRYFRSHWSSFPRHAGYLLADSARCATWLARISALGAGPKIGISWLGGTHATRRHLRSLSLVECLPILQRSDCEFICLQGGDCGEEIAEVRSRGIKLHWWPEATADMDELAALITSLDSVVAATSTLVHLGGALGKVVWVMVPANPEWRYLWQGDEMPWYPSAHLVRQKQSGDWRFVTQEIARQIGHGPV